MLAPTYVVTKSELAMQGLFLYRTIPVCMNQDFISMPVTQTSPTSILAQSPLGPMLSAGCGRPANIRVANGLHFTGLVLMSLGTFAALSCIVLMYSACRSAVGHLLHGGLRNKTTKQQQQRSVIYMQRSVMYMYDQ